jgi:DNA-binding CsgD family transcriptional regulator
LFDAEAHIRDGRRAPAEALAREAAAGFRRLRTPLLEAAALEVAGDIAGALALFRQCGATYDIRRLEQAGWFDQPDVREAVALQPELSAREREIARLAAAGRTNREIASQLYIAQKTVEKHLASAFQKLGISSRSQLI